MKLFKKIIGLVIYALFKHVSFRFIVPEKYASLIEVIRTYSLILQGAKIGSNSYIRNSVFVAYPLYLTIGNNTKIGAYSRLYNYVEFSVGDDTEIGSGLHVQTSEHKWENGKLPLAKQGAFLEPIVIGCGVYIGSNVTLLKGVKIADLCVIAAGSVVVSDTKSGFIYGGVPAKIISEIK